MECEVSINIIVSYRGVRVELSVKLVRVELSLLHNEFVIIIFNSFYDLELREKEKKVHRLQLLFSIIHELE